MKWTPQKTEWTAALVLTSLAVVLHGTLLTCAGALWRDEVNTVNVATLPELTQVWDTLPLESFPLLPFCAIRGWAMIVGSHHDFGLRLFGFVVGLSILAALWFNARQLGQRTPIWTLALLAFNPAFIRWDDSLRAYGLGTLFILLTFGFIWRVVASPTPRRVAAATLFALLSVQALYSNAFLIAAMITAGALLCGLARQWKKAAILIGIGLIAALSLLPYVKIIQRAKNINQLIQAPFSFGQILTSFFQAAGSANPLMAWGWIGLGLLAMAAVAGLFLWKKNWVLPEKYRALYGLVNLVGSIALFILFLKLAGLQSSVWYYLPLLAVWAASLEMIFSTLPANLSFDTGIHPAALRLGLPVVMAALLFFPCRSMLLSRQTNMDQLVQILEKNAEKNDLVLVSPWFYGVSFSRYYHGPAAWLTVPNLADHRIHRYDLMRTRIMSEHPIDDVLMTMTETMRTGHRIWVVGSVPLPEPHQKVPVLPPAPHSAYGWNSGNYDISWGLQVGAFLETHALRANPVNLGDQNVVPSEHPALMVFEGWHEK